MLKFDISEVLGERISRIVNPFDIEDLYVLIGDSIAYKVVVDGDMFGGTFSNRVVGHKNGTLIVTTNGNGFEIISEFPKHLFNSYDLVCTITQSHVFCLSR